MTPKLGWFYFDAQIEKWSKEAVPLSELEDLYSKKLINDDTFVLNERAVNRNPRTSPITYSKIIKPKVVVAPSGEELWAQRQDSPVTVICGPNNTGKTFILKQLWMEAGADSYLLAVSRFSSIGIINTRAVDSQETKQYQLNFLTNFHTAEQNAENNDRDLGQIITGLEGDAPDRLFKTCGELLGSAFSIKRVNPEAQFSPSYIDMDGEKLAVGSSGTRLLMTMLGILFDRRFSTVLIDEPELGLSPKVQVALARLMYDPVERQKNFPHLRSLIVATHSHLFLNRLVVSSNLTVKKYGINISVRPMQSASEFSSVQFNLLGNDLESIFLPSAMVIVEGDSDATFLERLFQIHLPGRKVAFIRGGGDGESLKKVNIIADALGDLSTNPFTPRLFVLLDKKNSVRLDRLIKAGVRSENIVVLSKNGVEFSYPRSLIAKVFRCTDSEIDGIDFEEDPIECSGIRKTKKELAEEVASDLIPDMPVHVELEGLLEKVRLACQ